MPIRLGILGAGGHAAVVISAARESGMVPVRVFDQDSAKVGDSFSGLTIEHFDADQQAVSSESDWHVAVGDNCARRNLAALIEDNAGKIITIFHPMACVDKDASIGSGVFIAPLAAIAARATIGDGVIINHGAIVDHDCRVGSWAHIAPGAILGGGVTVGEASLVGAGAVVLPSVEVGENCTIGAGSVVTRDVASGMTVCGVPAKRLLK